MTQNNEPKKFCPDCNKRLPLKEFPIDLRYGTAAGLSHICTDCKDKSTEEVYTSRKEMLLKKIGFKGFMYAKMYGGTDKQFPGLRALAIGKVDPDEEMTDEERNYLKNIQLGSWGMFMSSKSMDDVEKDVLNRLYNGDPVDDSEYKDDGYPDESYIPGKGDDKPYRPGEDNDNDPFEPIDDRPPDFY